MLFRTMNRTNETIYEATTLNLIDLDGSSHFAEFGSPWESRIDNRTDNATKIDYFYFYEKEQLAMLWILFVSIIFGNCSVLMTLLFSKGRGSRFRFFIKHLAIADLSVGLVSVMTDIIWKFTVEWKAGNIACKIVKYSQVVVTYSSTYILVALTIDRYDAITHPMNFSKSWKRAKVLVSTAWLLSFLFSAPIIVLYEEKSIEGRVQCWIDLLEGWHWQVYMTLISLTVFFIPACIIATCYSFIIYTIWSKTNIMKQDETSRHTFGAESGSNSMDADCRRVSSRGLIPRAKIKTIKMTLIIVFVFIFCWSPYMIFDLLQVFGYIEKTQSNIALATFIQSLAPLNSAANPIIYCIFSPFVCHVQRKSVFLQCLTKWCFQNSQFGTGRKITDTATFSNVSRTSKNNANLHNLSGVKNISRANKTNRASAPPLHAYEYKTYSGPSGSKVLTNAIETVFSPRRMFPTLKVRFHGLSISTTYIVYMDIVPVGETRYRYIYHSSKWMATGTSEVYSGNNIYVHPDSPATGQLWTSQGHISFDKIKLTNNKRPIMTGQVSLNSMHKYQPRIHILEVPLSDNLRLNSAGEIMEYIRENRERTAVFTFKQTAFITVTAYQNQDITKLKIQSNPFAKGFREPSKPRYPLNTLPVFETPSE